MKKKNWFNFCAIYSGCVILTSLVLLILYETNNKFDFDGIWINSKSNDQLTISYINDKNCQYIVRYNYMAYSWCFSKILFDESLVYKFRLADSNGNGIMPEDNFINKYKDGIAYSDKVFYKKVEEKMINSSKL